MICPFPIFLVTFLITLNFFCASNTYSSEFLDLVEEFKNVGVKKESVGISIIQIPTEIDEEKLKSFDFNHNVSYNPASAMKILTTMAAFQIIGKDFKFKTYFLTDGVINNKTLNGNIYIVGGGDPKLVIEDIDEIVLGIRNLGINSIRGNWIVDDSLFSEPEVDPSNFDGKPYKPYNVGPNAAMINFKSTEIFVENAKLNNRLFVTLRPELAGVEVKNRLRLIRGGCYRNKISTELRKEELIVFGKFGRSCKNFSFFISLMDHYNFGFSVFKKSWEKSGGKFLGKALKGKAPITHKNLFVWKSPRNLHNLIEDINKMSNNPMARNLFLYLSARSNSPATLKKSNQIINSWLKSKSFDFSDVVIHNGSGLSRDVRITPQTLSLLLVDALNDESAIHWLRTLPLAGVEGTVSSRFKNKKALGNAWLKTGSLKGVQAYSGYVRTAKNNWFAISILVNDRLAEKSKIAMDDVVEWLYANN